MATIANCVNSVKLIQNSLWRSTGIADSTLPRTRRQGDLLKFGVVRGCPTYANFVCDLITKGFPGDFLTQTVKKKVWRVCFRAIFHRQDVMTMFTSFYGRYDKNVRENQFP